MNKEVRTLLSHSLWNNEFLVPEIFTGASTFEICDQYLLGHENHVLFPLWEEFIGLIGRPSYIEVDMNFGDITLSFLFPSSQQRAKVHI